MLLEPEARELLADYAVPFPPTQFCDSAGAVRAAAASFPGPIALKVVSHALPHKSDAGGVALDVAGPEEAVRAFERIRDDVARHLANNGGAASIRGVLVSPMMPPPVAELLVGVRRHQSFGPVLTFGAGGTTVELLQDTTLRVLPIDRRDAHAMLDEVRVGSFLHGFRGGSAVDPELVVDVLLGLARCALEHQEIAEIEVNPLFAYPDRVVAVDVRAYLAALAA